MVLSRHLMHGFSSLLLTLLLFGLFQVGVTILYLYTDRVIILLFCNYMWMILCSLLPMIIYYGGLLLLYIRSSL
jgi:hypothetical protein